MKKKKIVLIGSIIIGILMGTIIGFYVYKRVHKIEKIETTFTEEIAKDLYNNSYKVFYLLQGDIGVSEKKVVVDEKTYYSVDDELLSDIHSLKDIRSLITNTFVKAKSVDIFNLFKEEGYNQYFTFQDSLYVYKGNKICKNIQPLLYQGTIFKAIEPDKVLVYPDELEVYAYNEANGWRLGMQQVQCLDDESE